MKANELMIGDWVKTNDSYKAIKYVKVYAISQYSVQDETTSQWIGCQHIEPIPLAVEILKKNGWFVRKANKMGVIIFTQQFEFSDILLGIEESIESRIDCDPYDDFHYMCNGKSFCYINSVHELQHALKLCGIDKNIEL